MIDTKLGPLSTNLGALRRIKMITGKDPFKWVSSFNDPSFDTIEALEAVTAAGRGKDSVTDDLRKELDEISPVDAIALITQFINAAFGVEEPKAEPGEVKTPAHK
jgi:hypothetical protein